MYQCPRCDKLLTHKELSGGKCIGCNLEFAPVRGDIEKLSRDTLLETFANEVTKEHRGIDHYNTAINMIKAYLVNVVCFRRKSVTSFFLVSDMEIKCFLFRVDRMRTLTRLQFDFIPKYSGIKKYNYEQVIGHHRGKTLSCFESKNFEEVLDIAMGVYQIKKRKFGNSSTFVNETNFYTVRTW